MAAPSARHFSFAHMIDRCTRPASGLCENPQSVVLGLSLRHPAVGLDVPALCRARSSRARCRRLSAQPTGTRMEILCNPRSCGDLEEGGRARIELLGLLKKNSAREAHNVVRLRQPVALVLKVIGSRRW